VPVVTVIAGPNGSGKSTITGRLTFEGRERLLDPDAVAKRLNPVDPSAAAIAAGREVLERTDEYFATRVSFAMETTLASRRTVEKLREAQATGFEIDFVFVALNNPERNISRIIDRVAKGGHFVPDEDVRRRYARSMLNAVELLRFADRTRVYDNSDHEARLILTFQCGTLSWRADPLPAWAESFL
jgi:predicted ABC-type ATPase